MVFFQIKNWFFSLIRYFNSYILYVCSQNTTMLDTLQKINTTWLNWFNSFSNNSLIETFVVIFVDLPIFILPLFLLGYWFYYNGNLNWFIRKYSFTWNHEQKMFKKEQLMIIFYGTVVALITSLIIQQFVNIDRPEQHLTAWWKLLLDHLPDASFPSDHATVSMAFWMGILLAWYKQWSLALLFPFIFMNLSRVIAWVHWPFDILVWTFVGCLMAYLTYKYIHQLKFVKTLNLWIMKMLNYIKL